VGKVNLKINSDEAFTDESFSKSNSDGALSDDSFNFATEIVQEYQKLFETANINHRFIAFLLYYFFVEALRQFRQIR
jgi:hypothetical protein